MGAQQHYFAGGLPFPCPLAQHDPCLLREAARQRGGRDTLLRQSQQNVPSIPAPAFFPYACLHLLTLTSIILIDLYFQRGPASSKHETAFILCTCHDFWELYPPWQRPY